MRALSFVPRIKTLCRSAASEQLSESQELQIPKFWLLQVPEINLFQEESNNLRNESYLKPKTKNKTPQTLELRQTWITPPQVGFSCLDPSQ